MIAELIELRMNCLTVLLIIVKIVSGKNQTDLSTCPTWYSIGLNGSTVTKECTCKDIEGLVTCVRDVQQVRLSEGVCMTFNDTTEETEVGKCPYAIFDRRYAKLQTNGTNGYIDLPKNVSELNKFMCESWGRKGYLCSDCKDRYGLTIANSFINCVKCKFPKKVAWLFYFMLELIPLTVLFFIVSVFRISLAKPPLNAFVVVSQVALALLFTRAHQFHPPYVMDSSWMRELHRFYLIVLGVWGMSQTRLIESITNFCVDPNINVQQAFTLTQIQSLFPLLLIALTSIIIELHARNCRLIVLLWKPFHKCFVCCTRVWNSKLSLIDVFSTYLLLSYSRFVVQLHFIFSFQRTYKLSNEQCSATKLLYNPTVQYFHTVGHLPYALVLLLIFLIIALPPVLLLAFYQFKLFQKAFQFTGLYRSRTIRTFIDLFHGCYKDGTNDTYDFRFTASLYLLVRVAVLLSLILCDFSTLASCETMSVFLWVFLLLLFIALVRPYKKKCMNVLDSLLFAGLAVVCVLLTGVSPSVKNQHVNLLILIVIFIVIGMPQAVIFTYVVYKICRYLCMRPFFMTFKAKLKPKSLVKFELVESIVERTDDSYNLIEEF